MANQTLRAGTPADGHVVDVGASYFTVSDGDFRDLVEAWIDRGVAREWTHVFHVAEWDRIVGPKFGPLRYAAPRGLRSLVEDLAADLPTDLVTVRHPVDVASVRTTPEGVEVDGEPFAAVALCGPDPQTARLLIDDDQGAIEARHALVSGPTWDPVLALVAVYDDRCWPDLDGVFVNSDAVLSWIADDGRRRGDEAPVLVAHSTPVVAAGHLGEPLGAAAQMLAAVARVLRTTGDPAWFTVKRWTYARPASARAEPCWFDGRIGLAGDGWAGGPRVEAAWLSGRTLAHAICARES